MSLACLIWVCVLNYFHVQMQVALWVSQEMQHWSELAHIFKQEKD